MKRTGGRWNGSDPPKYFVAGNPSDLLRCAVDYPDVLVAVNELGSEGNLAKLRTIIDRGQNVLLDSGIFWLTNEHKRAHGCSMDEALALPPEEIDGFDALLDRYTRIVREFGSKVWGYIELDQGGRDNKRRTRALLEDSLGLKPIPVYHPLNDGWEYFDELAENYERICFGNIVQADAETRKRLIATAWERRAKHPKLWIHLLGMTPNHVLHAFPSSSCDSSAWLVPVLWPDGVKPRTMGHPYFSTSAFAYHRADTGLGDGTSDGYRAKALGIYDSEMLGRNWRAYLADVASAIGANVRGDHATRHDV